MKTMLFLGAVLASAATANLQAIDERAGKVMAALNASNADADALLSSVERLAAGQMTPAERQAWQQDLARRAQAARDVYAVHRRHAPP